MIFVVNFTMTYMTGADPPRIVRLAARRLNTRIDGCIDSYTRIFEKDI